MRQDRAGTVAVVDLATGAFLMVSKKRNPAWMDEPIVALVSKELDAKGQYKSCTSGGKSVRTSMIRSERFARIGDKKIGTEWGFIQTVCPFLDRLSQTSSLGQTILGGAAAAVGAGTSNDTELEKLKKRLQFVMYCIDCFVS
jgi:hypothetical protein